jgi:hypothetical protein
MPFNALLVAILRDAAKTPLLRMTPNEKTRLECPAGF